jgi:cytochrome c oxidase subunit 2
VVGHQWWWEYRYLNASGEVDFVTANEMHIPVDTVVNLDLRSTDVIHSFSVPKLAGTRDAVPGRENHMWFIAREIGEYQGQCKELCGLSHALMRTVVFAESSADYSMWADVQRSPSVAATTATQAGLDIFLAKGCVGCHTIHGVENAKGTVGPDLTHFGARSTVAANILDNQPAELAEWLRDPPSVKPGSIMPDLGLSETEITAISAYLASLQ